MHAISGANYDNFAQINIFQMKPRNCLRQIRDHTIKSENVYLPTLTVVI